MRLGKKIQVALAMAVLLLFGMSFAQGTSQYAGQTVRFLRHSGYGADWMRAQIPAFEKATGIKVEMDTISYSNMHDKQVVELSSGSSPHDIYTIPDYWVGQYVSSKWLAPLNTCIQPGFNIQDVPQSLRDLNTIDGNLYVMPYKYNTRLLFYNEKLLQQAGLSVPKTWDDYLAAAKKLTGNGVYGVDLSLSPENLTDLFRDFLASAGGQFLTADNKPAFNSPQGVEAVDFMKQLLQYAPPGALTRQWPDTSNLMGQGKVAMAFLIPNFAGELNDPSKSTVAGDIGFAVIPAKVRSSTYVSTWGIGIASSSKVQGAACEFIQWLDSAKELSDFTTSTDGAIIPARASVLTDPAIDAKYPVMGYAEEAAKGAWTWPTQVTVLPDIKNIIARNLQQALSGQVTTQKALDQAEAEVAKTLSQAGN